jgi:hypothetical protein
MESLFATVFLLLACLSAATIAAAPNLIFIPVSAEFSDAQDINARGDVLGTTSGGIVFVFSPRTGLRTIDTQGVRFGPRGLNNRGDIVGFYVADPFVLHGGVLSRGGVFMTFDVPGAEGTVLTDINSRGTIVGFYAAPEQSGFHGFSSSGGTLTFIDAPSGALETLPTSIADDGTIVGSFGGEFDSHGFILRNGEWTTVDYPGALQTSLTGITPRGVIVGIASFDDIDPDGRIDRTLGFVYDGRFQDVGADTFPMGVNAAGTVAGFVQEARRTRAFYSPKMVRDVLR